MPVTHVTIHTVSILIIYLSVVERTTCAMLNQRGVLLAMVSVNFASKVIHYLAIMSEPILRAENDIAKPAEDDGAEKPMPNVVPGKVDLCQLFAREYMIYYLA